MTLRPKLAVALTVLSGLLSALTSVLLWWPDALAAEGPVGVARLDGGGMGLGYLGAALATGLSSVGAGYAVGNVGTAAIGAMAEKPELLGRLLILVGLAEGIAIYGLIVSILILNRLT
jgi:V/A-type H+/Na+-transporting ATPase subunit K